MAIISFIVTLNACYWLLCQLYSISYMVRCLRSSNSSGRPAPYLWDNLSYLGKTVTLQTFWGLSILSRLSVFKLWSKIVHSATIVLVITMGFIMGQKLINSVCSLTEVVVLLSMFYHNWPLEGIVAHHIRLASFPNQAFTQSTYNL